MGRAGAPTLSAGDAVTYALGAFRKNAAPLIPIALVVAAVQGLAQLLVDATDHPVTRFLGSLVVIVVSWALSLGLVQAALAVLDGRRPEISMLFSSPKLGGYLVGSLLAGVAVSFGLVLCVIPGLVLLFLFQLWGYAFVDGPGSDPVAAIKTSVDVVRANVGPVLVLDLLLFVFWISVFLALALVTVLLPIVGLLALVAAGILAYPITALALAYAWRRLTGGVVGPVS